MNGIPVFFRTRNVPYIIAEAGVNHNGDIGLARELVRAAKASGADCVKFQTFSADRVASAFAPKASYQLKVTDPGESQIAMLKALELSDAGHREVKALCDAVGIDFLSTPYNFADVDYLDGLNVLFFKLASIHCAEPAFVDYVARKGKPIVLSTGMATLAEVDIAVRALRQAGNSEFVLLQCTTDYPADIDEANLAVMATLGAAFSTAVGYSDHVVGATAAIAAVAMGATMIEKHITLDKRLPGPDHATSMDPDEFAQLVKNLRETRRAIGSVRKQPSESELRNMPGMRRSIVAARPLKAGHEIGLTDLDFRRPASGISAGLAHLFIGRRAARDLEEGTQFTWADIAGP